MRWAWSKYAGISSYQSVMEDHSGAAKNFFGGT
jgi:hypothetical protein